MKLKFSLIVTLLFVFWAGSLTASALTYDLGINPGDVSFSKELVAGQPNRIYAKIHNVGTEDILGYVTFYQGTILIGNSQPISVRSGGLADEVYVDWTTPSGSFNIRADINGQNPQDENPANDQLITSLFVPLPDTDGDADPDTTDPDDDNDDIPDGEEINNGTNPVDNDTDDDGCLDNVDNFPLDPNLCTDTDSDGIDDTDDTDDDNDGWSDDKENKVGTDPKNPDSDGDGYIDSQDYCPLWSNCTVAPDKTEPNNSKTNTNSASNIEPKENPSLNSGVNQNPDGVVLGEKVIDDTINLGEIKQNNQPIISISAEAKDWQTFIFSPNIRNLDEVGLTYSWDFGDGSQSEAKTIEHAFSKSGDYLVTLKIFSNNAILAEITKSVHISLFHFGNIYLTLWLSALILILIIFLVIYVKTRKNAKD